MTRANITCYLHNGVFEEKEIASFKTLASQIKKHQLKLWNMPVNAIIELLDKLGQEILLDKELSKEEGIPFLSMWLREKNIKEMIKLNIGNIKLLDQEVEVKEGRYLRAQPRGIVCHWIAGNIPTLAAFSLFQSVLCKNGNIVRTPQESIKIFLAILKKLDSIVIEYEGKEYSGKDILNSIAAIYYPSDEYTINSEFSLVADCKAAWGGKEAIDAIRTLPQRDHCETIIFGPKYVSKIKIFP